MNPSVQSNDERFLELLERWLAGDFTRKDERELHALTENDPFRREAWEGFASMPEGDHQQSIEQLRQRLFPRRRQAFFSLNQRWLAAAAMLVFVLAALYFIPDWTARDANPVAQSAPAEPPTPAAPAPATGTTAASDEGGRPNLPAPSPRDYSGPATSTADRASDTEDLAAAAPERPAPARPFENIPTKPGYQPPIRVGGPQTPLQTDIGGQGSISNAALPAQAPAVEPEAAKARAASLDTLARQMDELTKQKAGATKKAKEKAAGTEAAPEGGWDNFRRYLYQNARLTNDARNNNITGTVRVQFYVGKDGSPGQVKVLQSLGYGCDEEAGRLIRNVRWSPAGAGPVLVDVPFVR